uniref:Leucine-rich repeat-containing protein 32-like n=1 Tax=Haplochromis burtoni TaxID=8153 RepID=A0A3Q2VF06_HAPBU
DTEQREGCADIKQSGSSRKTIFPARQIHFFQIYISFKMLTLCSFNFKEQSWNNRNLSSIPVDLDIRIRRLDLSNNFIKQLHTLELPYLEQLDLSNNQLDLISEGLFENLVRLEQLNLSRNELNNNLAEHYLRNKSALDQLKMTGNALTRLSHKLFTESKSLRAIAIDDNLISEIEEGTFESLIQLEVLNLAKNNLAHICDFKLRQVKFLNLSRNSVEFFVTHEDSRLYRLEVLDLSHNKLLYFPIVPKMNRLRYLYLQNNMIGSYSEAALVSETNSLYSEITLSLLLSLETLNLSYNCLQSIIWDVRNDSDSGPLRQLFFRSLKHLDLQSNRLVYISPTFLSALAQIERLNLQDNSVQPCTSADHLGRTLKHLNLKGNGIKMLQPNTFQGTSLVSLSLAKNPSLVMQEGALEVVQTTLQSLIISEINLTSSRLLSLPCMPALTHLNVSNNLLDTIPRSLSCSPLREIDIRHNVFITLNPSLIRALSTNLTVMHISGNPFNCCDNRWLMVLNETEITVKSNPGTGSHGVSSAATTLPHLEACGRLSGQHDMQAFFKPHQHCFDFKL